MNAKRRKVFFFFYTPGFLE